MEKKEEKFRIHPERNPFIFKREGWNAVLIRKNDPKILFTCKYQLTIYYEFLQLEQRSRGVFVVCGHYFLRNFFSHSVRGLFHPILCCWRHVVTRLLSITTSRAIYYLEYFDHLTLHLGKPLHSFIRVKKDFTVEKPAEPDQPPPIFGISYDLFSYYLTRQELDNSFTSLMKVSHLFHNDSCCRE